MSGESKFWQDIRNPLKNMGQVDRIESHATVLGRPDVNLCFLGGLITDIELKYTDCISKGIKMRAAQKHWHLSRYRVGGYSCVLSKVVLDGKTIIMLHHGHVAAKLDKQLSYWYETHHYMWIEKINFHELEEMLRHETQERLKAEVEFRLKYARGT